MTYRREITVYIRDILENFRKALLFVEGVDFEGLINDEKTLYAIIRAIEVIGEAAKKFLWNFEKLIRKYPGGKLRLLETN